MQMEVGEAITIIMEVGEVQTLLQVVMEGVTIVFLMVGLVV